MYRLTGALLHCGSNFVSKLDIGRYLLVAHAAYGFVSCSFNYMFNNVPVQISTILINFLRTI